MDISEGNKLIAEFMEYDDVDCRSCKYFRDCNLWQCQLTNQEKEELLSYHSSWDWLMPVVAKISESEPDDDLDSLKYDLLRNNIEDVWGFIVRVLTYREV